MAGKPDFRPPPDPPPLHPPILNLESFSPLPSSPNTIATLKPSIPSKPPTTLGPLDPVTKAGPNQLLPSSQDDFRSYRKHPVKPKVNAKSSANVTATVLKEKTVSDNSSQTENHITPQEAPPPFNPGVSVTSNAVIAGLNGISVADIAKPTTIPPRSADSMTPAALNSQPRNSWAELVNIATDKSLQRLAPCSTSSDGVPRVVIPDSVFHKGAEIHKDFIIGVFMGKTPSYTQIQNVLTHIWGRGRKIEFHLKPLQRTMMVRIPNPIMRQKIVDQEFWYIGSTMFYVAQWTPNLAAQPPSTTSIPLWAHIKGLPFDLFHQQGLSLVAGLIGEPIETDDSTIRLSNLEVAHVKVRVNCTKELPSKIEFEREDGSVNTLTVTYPWTPAICSICKEMGHLKSRCPSSKWVPVSAVAHPPAHAATLTPTSEPVIDPINPMDETAPPAVAVSPSMGETAPPEPHPKTPTVTKPIVDVTMTEAPLQPTPPSPEIEHINTVYFGSDNDQSIGAADITHVLGLPAHKPEKSILSMKRPLFDPMETESMILPCPQPPPVSTPSLVEPSPIGAPSFFACLQDPDHKQKPPEINQTNHNPSDPSSSPSTLLNTTLPASLTTTLLPGTPPDLGEPKP